MEAKYEWNTEAGKQPERRRPGAYALLIATLLITAQSLAQVQQLPQEQSPKPIIGLTKSDETQASVQDQVSPEQNIRTSCSLKVPELSVIPNTKDSGTGEISIAYTPLSASCKFHLVLKQSYSPYTFVSAGYEAMWAEAFAQWPQYGGGMVGFGKRFGATLADTESRRFIQTFLLSSVLHQDPRYFPSNRKRLVSRAWYASTRVVITRNDNGNNTFNSSEVLGALFTSALQNSYYPRHYRTFDNTMSRFEGAISSDATSYLLREFTPDLKRLFRKHAPKRIRELEQKLPIPADDKP